MTEWLNNSKTILSVIELKTNNTGNASAFVYNKCKFLTIFTITYALK